MPIQTTTLNKYSIPFLLALVTSGLVGNYYNYPIFLNIDFIFGSIFAMLALQFFGLGRGVLAAALIASYTYILWNHPYAIIIMTAEVAVVGWLMNRLQTSMVLADTLYWLFIGMPLVFIFQHLVMHVSSNLVFISMTKLAINGIANALVARLIFTGITLSARSHQISFKDITYNLLAFFVLFPALIMLAVESRTDFTITDGTIRAMLAQQSKGINQLLNTWVGNRKLAILNLAELAASNSLQEMQSSLEQVKKSDINFKRVGLLDKEATITAYSPLLDELGQENIGKNFADRPFIPRLKQTLKPMLSEVVMGRIGNPKPMVTMLAPVLSHGEYAGYITGILSLEQVQELLDRSLAGNDSLYTLIDKNGNVIMSNRTDQTILTPFARDQGTLNRLDDGISQWVPFVPSNISISERWRKSFYVAESTLGDLAEWKLILEQPVAPFQRALFNNYSSKLMLLFVILLGALVLAEVFSRKSVVALERLRLATQDLPVKLLSSGKNIAWPESRINEVDHLVLNFRNMAELLTAQFKEINQINETLEQRVEMRTAEVKESGKRLDLALKATQDALWDWDLLTNSLYYSPRWFSMVGYEENELEVDPDLWRRLIHPEDLDRADQIVKEALAGKTTFEAKIRLLHKDGHYVPVLTRGFILRDDNNKPVRASGTNTDLTEQKRSEEAQRQWEWQQLQLQKVTSLNCMAGAIAHHFNNQLGIVIGNLELVVQDLPLGSETSRKLENSLLAAFKAADISRQMLLYLGHVTGERSQVDLPKVCRQTLLTLQSMNPKRLLVSTDLPASGPIINANTDQLQQVVTALVTNAWEAYGDRQGPLELTVKTISPAEINVGHRFPIGWQSQHVTYACLEVKDEADGIADEDIEKLFDPFFSRKFTGRGLGLPVVLGIVKAHNGAVAVESIEGKGSVFRVFLPVAS